MDAAAWRIGFEIPEAIGGAGVEAEPAVNTTSVVLVDGIEAGDGRRGHGWPSVWRNDGKAAGGAFGRAV